MAEIDLQHRKRPVWPWIAGALVVALAVWGIAEMVGPADEIGETEPIDVIAPTAEPMPVEPRDEATGELPMAVDDYVQTARGFATAEMGRQHEYTATALQALVPALQELVDRAGAGGTAARQQLEEVRSAADRIQRTEWTADTHADQVKAAFTATADLLEQLQRDMAAADEIVTSAVARVRDAADELAADEPLLEQRQAVERFFTASADGIERLARR